jgi:hypothetical protein
VSFNFGAFTFSLRLERRFQHLKSGVHRIDAMHQARILRAYRAPVHHRLQRQDAVPVFGAVEHDRRARRELLRLLEREDLEQLVERAEPAGEDDHRLGEVGEPELPHEEVVELEIQAA